MVIDQLQPMLDNVPPEPRTIALLSLFCESNNVQKMFRNSDQKFFPVVVGEYPGIYQSRWVIQESDQINVLNSLAVIHQEKRFLS